MDIVTAYTVLFSTLTIYEHRGVPLNNYLDTYILNCSGT